MIYIVTKKNGIALNAALSQILTKTTNGIASKAGQIMRNALAMTTKRHFQTIYPGSKHYSPDKVTEGQIANSNNSVQAGIEIDVPGICRAYHSHTIRPIKGKYLTIPLHREAYGKKVSEFNGQLFKPKGKNILAMNKGGQLVAMYALATSAFQRQDKRLMPSDQTFSDNIFARLKPLAAQQFKQAAQTF